MITPVIFFTLVIGVIDGFQYFDQASCRRRRPARRRATRRGRCSSTASGCTSRRSRTSTWATRRRWRGCCSSPRWRRTAILFVDRQRGCTTGEGCHSHRRRHLAPRAGGAGRRAAPPDAAGHRQPRRADRGLAGVRAAGAVHAPDGAHDRPAGALGQPDPAPVRVVELPRRCSPASTCPATPGTRSSTRASSTVGVVISSVPVAYAFSRIEWRGRNVVLLLVLSTLMLPPQVTSVPLYILFVEAVPRLDRDPVHRHAEAADHPELLRRRVLDLPAAPVLHDDPEGAHRRGPGRRRRRAGRSCAG